MRERKIAISSMPGKVPGISPQQIGWERPFSQLFFESIYPTLILALAHAYLASWAILFAAEHMVRSGSVFVDYLHHTETSGERTPYLEVTWLGCRDFSVFTG